LTLIKTSFYEFIPFLRRTLLKLGVGLLHKVDAGIWGSKISRQNFFKIFFLFRHGIGIHKVCEEILGFNLILLNFILDFLFHPELFLNFRLITAIYENSLPPYSIDVYVDSLSTHNVIPPVAIK